MEYDSCNINYYNYHDHGLMYDIMGYHDHGLMYDIIGTII